MLKVDQKILDHMEENYPGIKKEIAMFEDAILPACPLCLSADTAKVSCGVIGRSTHIAMATSKIKLLMSGPIPGKYYCNKCKKFFDETGSDKDAKPASQKRYYIRGVPTEAQFEILIPQLMADQKAVLEEKKRAGKKRTKRSVSKKSKGKSKM